MQKVMNLMNQMVLTFNLPFVTQMVSMYTKIFDELCHFCDKVADYAKTIEREAEKTLGAKGSWNQNTNSKNSVLRMSEKAEIQLKTGVRIEDIAL